MSPASMPHPGIRGKIGVLSVAAIRFYTQPRSLAASATRLTATM